MSSTLNKDTGVLSTAPTAPKRFVTSHDNSGDAIFTIEGDIPQTKFYKSEEECAIFYVPWTSQGFPVNISETEDRSTSKVGPLASKEGIVCRYVDFPPKSISPMHRTQSLDYGVVIFGTLVLELDNGEKRTMTQSDVVVQRGTIHQWHNTSSEWARMMFVLITSEAVEVDGKALPATM